MIQISPKSHTAVAISLRINPGDNETDGQRDRDGEKQNHGLRNAHGIKRVANEHQRDPRDQRQKCVQKEGKRLAGE